MTEKKALAHVLGALLECYKDKKNFSARTRRNIKTEMESLIIKIKKL